jgi:hypothetical protein
MELHTVEVEHVGTLKSFYLSPKELEMLGTSATCCKCGDEFIIGKHEMSKIQYDENNKFKHKLEVWTEEDELVCLNLKHTPIPLYPDDDSKMAQYAVLFGLESFTKRLCPKCYNYNQILDDVSGSKGKMSSRTSRVTIG